jgi:hypothetical protein
VRFADPDDASAPDDVLVSSALDPVSFRIVSDLQKAGKYIRGHAPFRASLAYFSVLTNNIKPADHTDVPELEDLDRPTDLQAGVVWLAFFGTRIVPPRQPLAVVADKTADVDGDVEDEDEDDGDLSEDDGDTDDDDEDATYARILQQVGALPENDAEDEFDEPGFRAERAGGTVVCQDCIRLFTSKAWLDKHTCKKHFATRRRSTDTVGLCYLRDQLEQGKMDFGVSRDALTLDSRPVVVDDEVDDDVRVAPSLMLRAGWAKRRRLGSNVWREVPGALQGPDQADVRRGS